jgi:hypothetical protein
MYSKKTKNTSKLKCLKIIDGKYSLFLCDVSFDATCKEQKEYPTGRWKMLRKMKRNVSLTDARENEKELVWCCAVNLQGHQDKNIQAMSATCVAAMENRIRLRWNAHGGGKGIFSSSAAHPPSATTDFLDIWAFSSPFPLCLLWVSIPRSLNLGRHHRFPGISEPFRLPSLRSLSASSDFLSRDLDLASLSDPDPSLQRCAVLSLPIEVKCCLCHWSISSCNCLLMVGISGRI